MKPFNLERALAGAPVVTRDGGKVLDIKKWKTMPVPHTYPLICLVEQEDGIFTVTYTLEGRYCKEVDSLYDLFMESKTV